MSKAYARPKARHASASSCFAVYDPVCFAGGSKVAMEHIMTACQNPSSKPIIVTCDPKSWHRSHHIIRLRLPKALKQASCGMTFYAKQVLLATQFFFILLRHPYIKNIAVISGPAVDIAALVVAKIFKKNAIQLIQGPISSSKISIIGLKLCTQLFYLTGCKANINQVINHQSQKFKYAFNHKSQAFINGLPLNQWPSCSIFNSITTQQNNAAHIQPIIFWAASLLKWKGLNILEDALNNHLTAQPIIAKICYLQPKETSLACCNAPINSEKIQVWQAPNNLDEIRSRCNIFVSTSQKEPFGLSILEAMAAGLCPLIPKDGAYWDTQLTHGINCLKYQPNNAQSLAQILIQLNKHRFCISFIGQNAQKKAAHYKAHITYSAIINALNNEPLNAGNITAINDYNQESRNA